MEKKTFKKVFRAEKDYLTNSKNYKIIKTKFKDPQCEEIKEIIDWLNNNVEGSFSIAINDTTDWFVTVRIWDIDKLDCFLSRFSNYLYGEI